MNAVDGKVEVLRPAGDESGEFLLVRLPDDRCYSVQDGEVHGPAHLDSFLRHCHCEFEEVPPARVPGDVVRMMAAKGVRI